MTPTALSNTRARAPLPATVDVAIVGAGLGGLVAGAYLARAGRRVAIFDAHYVAGGCCTVFTRKLPGAGRAHFDVGLHYVGDCGPGGAIPSILADLGVDVRFRPMDSDGFDTLVFPDFRFRIPANLELYRDRLIALFPAEKRGIDAYVRLLREVDFLSGRMGAGGRPGLGVLFDVLRHGRLGARYQGHTIGRFLEDHVRDPKLRAVMLGQAGDYGLPPSKVSAMLHAGLAMHYFKGAYYPVGGGQVIADGLAAVIEGAGGSVHLRAPVERILVRDGRAAGVRVQPRNGPAVEVAAGVVLSNADLKRTLLELVEPGALPADTLTRARGYEMAGAIFMTFLGLRGDLRDLGLTDTNYWAFDGYDFERFFGDGQRDGPKAASIRGCYITSASLKDPDTPTHAPEGHQTLEIMALVPGDFAAWGVRDPETLDAGRYGRAPAYQAIKEDIEANLVARLDRLFPGAAERIVYRESATPVTHTRFTGATGGTGYGLAATPAQFLQHRPGYRGPLPGLYFCGASTRSGHGVVGAMMSGRAAARAVTQGLAGSGG